MGRWLCSMAKESPRALHQYLVSCKLRSSTVQAQPCQYSVATDGTVQHTTSDRRIDTPPSLSYVMQYPCWYDARWSMLSVMIFRCVGPTVVEQTQNRVPKPYRWVQGSCTCIVPSGSGVRSHIGSVYEQRSLSFCMLQPIMMCLLGMTMLATHRQPGSTSGSHSISWCTTVAPQGQVRDNATLLIRRWICLL